MPVTNLNEAEGDQQEAAAITAFTTPEGEPTLEARAASDFLSHADFSAVFEHEAVQPHVLTVSPVSESYDGRTDESGLYSGDYADMTKHPDMDYGVVIRGAGADKEKTLRALAAKHGGVMVNKDGKSHLFLVKDKKTGRALANDFKTAFAKAKVALGLREADLDPDFSAWLAEAGCAAKGKGSMKGGKLKKMDYKESIDEAVTQGFDLHMVDGEVAAQVIDADDLTDMFESYVEHLKGNIEESTSPLLAAAQARVLEGLLESDRDGLGVMLLNLLSEGLVLDTAATLPLESIKEANVAALKRGARRAALGESDAELTSADVPQFGASWEFEGQTYEAAVDEAAEVEIRDAEAGDEGSASEAPVTEAVRVVNHAGSGRTGPQLVAEAAKAGQTPHEITESRDSEGNSLAEGVAEQNAERRADGKNRSSGARLAAGMTGLNRR